MRQQYYTRVEIHHDETREQILQTEIERLRAELHKTKTALYFAEKARIKAMEELVKKYEPRRENVVQRALNAISTAWGVLYVIFVPNPRRSKKRRGKHMNSKRTTKEKLVKGMEMKKRQQERDEAFGRAQRAEKAKADAQKENK